MEELFVVDFYECGFGFGWLVLVVNGDLVVVGDDFVGFVWFFFFQGVDINDLVVYIKDWDVKVLGFGLGVRVDVGCCYGFG